VSFAKEMIMCEASPAFDIEPEDVENSDTATFVWEIK